MKRSPSRGASRRWQSAASSKCGAWSLRSSRRNKVDTIKRTRTRRNKHRIPARILGRTSMRSMFQPTPLTVGVFIVAVYLGVGEGVHAQNTMNKQGYAPVNGLKMYYEIHG